MVTRDQLDFVLVISKCKYQLRIVAGRGGKKKRQPPHSDAQESYFGKKAKKNS